MIQRSPFSVFKGVNPIRYAGRELLPLIEGGKGVAVSNHASSGAWAAAGGIGTISAVNADSYDPTGKIITQVYSERSEEHTSELQSLLRKSYAAFCLTKKINKQYQHT